jgi:DUF1016 N-terminal domain
MAVDINEQLQPQFTEILDLIKDTQNYVITASNQELIKLYWSIGKYLDDRLQATDWGKKTVQQLADFIQAKEPVKGFEKRNLERMRQSAYWDVGGTGNADCFDSEGNAGFDSSSLGSVSLCYIDYCHSAI